MANEIQLQAVSLPVTAYVVIVVASSETDAPGKFWNGSTFETYNESNWSSLYGNIPLTRLGTSSLYIGNFPQTIPAGRYYLYAYSKLGSNPAPTDLLVGTQDSWVWDGHSLTVPDLPEPSGTTHYIDVTDVRNFKVDGEVVDLSNFTDDEITDEILIQESIIETLTNNIFYEKTEVNYFDGSGLCRLFFIPKIVYPLITVNSVKIVDFDETTVIETFVENQDFLNRGYYLETAASPDFIWATGYRNIRTNYIFTLGIRNIKIDGVWGKSICPPAIRKAANILTLENLLPGSTNITPKDTVQATWPDFSITFKGKDNFRGGGGQSTGFFEVDRLLEPHINHIDMFLVIPAKKQLYDGGTIRL